MLPSHLLHLAAAQKVDQRRLARASVAKHKDNILPPHRCSVLLALAQAVADELNLLVVAEQGPGVCELSLKQAGTGVTDNAWGRQAPAALLLHLLF